MAATADKFEELRNALAQQRIDIRESLVAEAGVDYPEEVSILAQDACL